MAVLLVAGICGFAVIAVPGAGDAIKPATAEPLASENQQPRPDNAGWYAGEHVLERDSDGHFYASALVDNTELRMLVDTGASVIALTGDDAAAIGLNWDDSEIRHVGSGASGAVYGVPVTLRSVEIGGMARSDIQAIVIPEGLHISLLGQSYLAQIGAVEIFDDKMVMRTQ